MTMQENGKTNCDILIKNTSILTGGMQIRRNVSLAIGGGRILAVMDKDVDKNVDEDKNKNGNGRTPGRWGGGPGEVPSECLLASDWRPARILDGRRRLFMPGLIDGHMHTGQQLLRGKILDAMPMIWKRIMLPFESTLTAEKMRLSAELAALEMISCGTTGFVDAGSYHMEAASEVYEACGLRGALSCSTMDDETLPASIRQSADEAVRSTDRLFEQFHGRGNLKVYYSLRTLLSCSEPLIRKAFERASEQGTMLQAHMNEYPNEINFCLERFSMRPFEYLDSLGVLSDRFLAAHSLLLSQHETELAAGYGVKMVHCPFSNCGKAVPDTPALLRAGLYPALGSDGTAHGGMSLWNEMKIFRSVINVTHGVRLAEPAVMPAETILAMATAHGAELLGERGRLGRIEAGMLADLISINLDQPHLSFTGNLVHTLVESVNAGDVADVIVNGRLLMKDREILVLDQERILKEAEALL